LKEKFSLAKLFYDSWIFEEAFFGDALIESAVEDLTPNEFGLLDAVAEHFHNWATVDWLCLRVLQPLLLRFRVETVELLKVWNRSENMWKRRASVVAFVRGIGSSGDFTDIMLEFCDNLVFDEEDLVLKGVGWALRDNISGAKEQVLQYIRSLRQRGVSSTVILYAIQNLKGSERDAVLRIGSQ
jgi:3-methyladenine DNA glycosylase AlkD